MSPQKAAPPSASSLVRVIPATNLGLPHVGRLSAAPSPKLLRHLHVKIGDLQECFREQLRILDGIHNG